jgi:ATP-dependent RNA helicase SUPV3L1/SUV3
MLERLADMIRPLEARAVLEATADMLSITGLTLEQFAKLMQGLGFDFQTGTRPKAKPARVVEAAPAAALEPTADVAAEEPVGQPEAEAAPEPAENAHAEEHVAEDEAEAAPELLAVEPDAAPEPEVVEVEAAEGEAVADPVADLETFYIFVRTPRRRPERPQREARKEPRRDQQAEQTRDQPREPRKEGAGGRKGRPDRRGGEGPRDKGKGPKPDTPRETPVTTARPPRVEKPIDPDNPFAALMALKSRF